MASVIPVLIVLLASMMGLAAGSCTVNKFPFWL